MSRKRHNQSCCLPPQDLRGGGAIIIMKTSSTLGENYNSFKILRLASVFATVSQQLANKTSNHRLQHPVFFFFTSAPITVQSCGEDRRLWEVDFSNVNKTRVNIRYILYLFRFLQDAHGRRLRKFGKVLFMVERQAFGRLSHKCGQVLKTRVRQ